MKRQKLKPEKLKPEQVANDPAWNEADRLSILWVNHSQFKQTIKTKKLLRHAYRAGYLNGVNWKQ